MSFRLVLFEVQLRLGYSSSDDSINEVGDYINVIDNHLSSRTAICKTLTQFRRRTAADRCPYAMPNYLS
jgi:hypothetical protein